MKRFFRIIVCLLVSFLSLLCVFVISSSSQEIESLKKGVVKVSSITVEGKQKVGTGFIVRLEADAAYIVTASHVVEGARKVQVEFFTRRNRPVPARTIGIEGGYPQGLATLLVEDKIPSGLSVLKLTSSLPVGGGDSVTTIGFPRIAGVPWATIPGNIIGRKGRAITFSGTVDEGNSGGPLIKEGLVIGVVTEVREQFAYAIPALIARYTLEGWGVKFKEEAKKAAEGAERFNKAEEPPVPSPPPVQLVSLTVHADKRELKLGERVTLKVRGKYSNGKEGEISRGVKWQSSDDSIVEVNSKGQLTAQKAGYTDITAHYKGLVTPPLTLIVKPLVKVPKEKHRAKPLKPAKPRNGRIKDHIKVSKFYRERGEYPNAISELEQARAIDPANKEVQAEIEITRKACNAEKRLGRSGLKC